eukprot:103126-Pyramimonas_sp.AAC.1
MVVASDSNGAIHPLRVSLSWWEGARPPRAAPLLGTCENHGRFGYRTSSPCLPTVPSSIVGGGCSSIATDGMVLPLQPFASRRPRGT